MTTPPADNHLPPEIEARLDALLTAWTAQTRLTPAAAEAARRAALESAAPPADWWQTFGAPLMTTLRAAVGQRPLSLPLPDATLVTFTPYLRPQGSGARS
jgi:hypothetical protein